MNLHVKKMKSKTSKGTYGVIQHDVKLVALKWSSNRIIYNLINLSLVGFRG